MVRSTNNKQPIKLTDLNDLPPAKQYFIAYSGGMDSSALLHALSQEPQLFDRLTAIHVNHNINPESDHWAHHCQLTCERLNIPLITESVELHDHSEAACREARQNIFRQYLNQGDCLITGHHQNDQVETILFRLLRGTGLQGMTGISHANSFEHYTIYRPLLSINQDSIHSYVASNLITYVEDASNQDNNYSRNHIRNVIIPELKKYDDQVLQNIVLTAQNLKDSHHLLNQLIGHHNPLNFKPFETEKLLSSALYHWLSNLKQTAPSHKRLTQFSHDCLNAAPHKNPELILDQCILLRWKGQIYALKQNSFSTPNESDIHINLSSDMDHVLLPNNGKLIFSASKLVNISAVIRYQQGHENIKLDKHGQHKKLKNLFQQHGIPPWERKSIPYLYINDQLMAVGSNLLTSEFEMILTEYKAEYRWLSPQYIL